MPAGPSELGFVYFVAAKLIGYTGYCRGAIQPICLDEKEKLNLIPSSWKAGAVRTGIGVVIGAAIGLSFWKIPYFAQHDLFDNGVFFALLVPVRVFEWWLLLRWVYGKFEFTPRQTMGLILVGILVSFLLDAVGLLAAFVLPGGMWVC